MGNSSSTTNKNSNTTTDPPKNGEESLNAKVGAKLGELLEPGSPLYTATLGTLQWQRDNYLIGTEYANKRQKLRDARPDQVFLPRLNHNVKIDPSTASMGYTQIVHLGSWFIPSDTVKQALMPIVLDQPRGALYPTFLRGFVTLIDSQQATVDALLKSTILDMLEQERVRKMVMNSTKGYITDKGSTSNNNNNNNLDPPPVERCGDG